jgi:hypothetical protein
MFDEFMKDIVTLKKQNGVVRGGIKAMVDSRIHIDLRLNPNLPPIESGDTLVHKQSNGVTEEYQILDPCYYDDDVVGKHYQCKVKKLSAIKYQQAKNIFNIKSHQTNIASDNATINAIQNNGIDISQAKALIEAVRQSIGADMSPENAENVTECLDVLEEQLAHSAPKKSVINTLLSGIKAIKGTAEFGAAVVALVQYIQQFMH